MTQAQDEILSMVYKELVKLNGLMEILVQEHLKHFQEWSEKNSK